MNANSKFIAILVVVLMTMAGATALAGTDADADKKLTVCYDGIVDPKDLATILGSTTPISADYMTRYNGYEPQTYTEMKQFELIEEFVDGDYFVVPVDTAAAWTASERTNYMKAFEKFGSDIYTEVVLASEYDKTIYLGDVEEYVAALALKDAQIAALEQVISEKTAKIAELEQTIAEMEPALKKEIAELKAQVEALKKDVADLTASAEKLIQEKADLEKQLEDVKKADKDKLTLFEALTGVFAFVAIVLGAVLVYQNFFAKKRGA